MNEILRANVDKKINSRKWKKCRCGSLPSYWQNGTAEKPSKIEKGYSKEIVNVFASAFPEKNPRYVLSVLIDELKVRHIFGNTTEGIGLECSLYSGQNYSNIGPTLATNDRELVRSYQNNINVKKLLISMNYLVILEA